MNNQTYLPLTPAVFYILLALAGEERHGYGIMKQAEQDSNGQIKMGPGTLYGSVKRMLDDKLIEETEKRAAAEGQERRIYYRITGLGKKLLRAELDRYKTALGRAKLANLAIAI